MAWVGQVLGAVGAVLGLHAPAELAQPNSWQVAVGVALLSSASMILGQIVVFQINRVRGWRLALGVAIGAVAYTGLRALLAVLLALLAWAVRGNETSASTLGAVYLYSTAPLIWGFLVAIPYLGLGIARILEAWSLLAMIAMLTTLMSNGWLALAAAAIVWGTGQLLSRVLAHPLSRFASWLWTVITRKPTIVTTNDILAGAPMIPISSAAS